MGAHINKTINNDFPLISIGLPVIKTDFLEEALSCCLKQTYTHIEIVILNNAGTETTGNEIESIIQKYPDNRIKYFRNETQLPIIQNWNKVLSLSKGDFFSLLCDDDYWDAGFIGNMVILAEKYPSVSVFHSRLYIVNEKDEYLRISPICPEWEDVFDFTYHRLYKGREQFLSDFFVKTDALKQIGGFVDIPGAWGSDDLTWITLSINSGIVFSSKPLYSYRDTPISNTNKMAIKKKIYATKLYFEQIQKIILPLQADDKEQELKKQMILQNISQIEKDYILGIYSGWLKNKHLLPVIYHIWISYYKIKVRFIK